MAPMQVKLRKAIGAFKDQTSISLAKVASTSAPDLDVALLKATSHDEVPIEDKYVQEIIYLTYGSRFNVSACVSGLARRLSKTHNWIVAIKTLMLAHRLLRDGDPDFRQELSLSGRRGMRVLSASDFRDESHSNGWDFSAFVRGYGMYLDERLDCSFGSIARSAKADKRPVYSQSKYEYSDSGYYGRDGYGSDGDRYYGRNGHGSRQDFDGQSKEEHAAKVKLVKDMQPEDLIESIPVLLRLLERLLACRPTGAAKSNRLVQIALYPVVRESFLIYTDVRDGLAILQDAFFDMEQNNCGQTFDVYNKAAKQVDELITFYSFCKTLGVCRSSEYPHVEKISEESLETMEDYVQKRSDSSRGGRRRLKSPEPRRHHEEADDEARYEVNGMKALPAPPAPLEKAPVPVVKATEIAEQTTNTGGQVADLLNITEPAMSSAEHESKLALALFSGTETSVNSKWETFPSAEQATPESGSNAGWELALIDSASDLSKPNGNALAGGFDHLLLDSLYEQGTYCRKVASAMNPVGSASSVAIPGQTQSNLLALPAPPTTTVTTLEEDPFVASVTMPPPSYVQMAEMRHKQQLAVQEHQLWMHYQHQGMQGYNNLMKFPTNPFAATTLQPSVAYYSPNPYYR